MPQDKEEPLLCHPLLSASVFITLPASLLNNGRQQNMSLSYKLFVYLFISIIKVGMSYNKKLVTYAYCLL